MAYVSVAAAFPETLRSMMAEFRAKTGVYSLPFAVNPDPDGCDLCRVAVPTLVDPDGNFEASIPVQFLTSLDSAEDRLKPYFTAYRLFPSECDHIFYLWMPDLLYPLLANVSQRVTIRDDRNLARHFMRTVRDRTTHRGSLSPAETRAYAQWLLDAADASENINPPV